MQRVTTERLQPLRQADPKRVGRYELLARLGAGGMGRVYLGRSRGGRTVAVKVIHPHIAEDPRFRRRFTQEVAAARLVGGFHAAQVVDADTDADPPWLVTEYIAGPSLQDSVDEHGPLPQQAVAALGAGLAEGLTAIHHHNVVHRDLKPGNVLLAQDGPRIIDFGIARAMDASSQTTRTSVIGTAGFMSPEQYRGHEIGFASDVFCLAAVLTFAATGRRPFGEGPAEALGYRVVNEEPDLTGVPASLLTLIEAGLKKDPGDRPGVGEFLDRCSALFASDELPLPAPVTTMITTQVAESEALAAAHDADAELAGDPDTGEPPPTRIRPRSEPSSSWPTLPWRKLWDDRKGIIVAAGVLLIAAAIWFGVDGEDDPSATDIPAYCTGGTAGWNPDSGMCDIKHVAGCQNVEQMLRLDTQLAKENPIGSSGYGGSTPVIPLLQQLKSLTDKSLKQPNIPGPINTALQNQTADLQQEMDLYNQRGDWRRVDFQRGMEHSPSIACMNFVADMAQGASP